MVWKMRIDRHNNPVAFTTDIAKQGKLILGDEYVQGDPFSIINERGTTIKTYYTAKLLGDPIALTIKVIDNIGFYTKGGYNPRWTYIGMPDFVWKSLTYDQKKKVIGYMYAKEGGTEMKGLFV